MAKKSSAKPDDQDLKPSDQPAAPAPTVPDDEQPKVAEQPEAPAPTTPNGTGSAPQSENDQVEATEELSESGQPEKPVAPGPRCASCGTTLALVTGQENFTHECPNCKVRFLVLADGTMEATGKGV